MGVGVEHSRRGVATLPTGFQYFSTLCAVHDNFKVPDQFSAQYELLALECGRFILQEYMERKRKRIRDRIEADILKAAAKRKDAETAKETEEREIIGNVRTTALKTENQQKTGEITSDAKEEETRKEDEQVKTVDNTERMI